jgi:hypothetical protein
MPKCWFILGRSFCRIDGSLIKMQDTRIFHRFGNRNIYMEVTTRRASLQQLERMSGRCLSGKELRDANFIAALFSNSNQKSQQSVCNVTIENYYLNL